jgi:hypothetical protein
MRHVPLVRGLVWSVAATLLLPILLTVTLGTASLLAAVGDANAAAVCRWAVLGLGILWIAALVATTALSALVTLSRGHDRAWRRRRRLRREAGR